MFSKFLQNTLGDLINSKDGTISLTRLAAVTAHFNAAWAFIYITVEKGFIGELWMIYLGAAIFHAGYDKTLMVTKGAKQNPPQ